MENAISKGVEAALRRILMNKEFPVTMKRSPRRRNAEDQEVRMERAAEPSHERDFILVSQNSTWETFHLIVKQSEVRRVFKDSFNISQDSDFITHQPAIREDVYSYEHEDGPGPDPQNFAFDLANGSKTPWNAKVLHLLFEELQERCTQEKWPFQRLDRYYGVLIEERYKRLRTVWRIAQRKITEKGVLETAKEVEERLVTRKDETLKNVRQSTRRRNVRLQCSLKVTLIPNTSLEICPKNYRS